MNAKIPIFVTCVEAIIYLLLYNLNTAPLTLFFQIFPGGSKGSIRKNRVKNIYKAYFLVEHRSVIRTLSKIFDVAFLRKQLKGINNQRKNVPFHRVINAPLKHFLTHILKKQMFALLFHSLLQLQE